MPEQKKKNFYSRSCHRSTTSDVKSSLSQETKGPEQLLDISPTRLLPGLPVVAGLGRAVENFGEVAWELTLLLPDDSGSMRTWASLLPPLRRGEARASSAPRISWPGGFLSGVVEGLRETAAAEWIEELGVLNKLLKACSEDCAGSVSVTITWESSPVLWSELDSAAPSVGGEIGGHLGCRLSSLLTSS